MSGRKESLFFLGLFTVAPHFSIPSGTKDSPSLSVTPADRLQATVLFPLLGSFSNCWFSRHTILLQKDAKCSLPSASGSRVSPVAPVCAGDILCHVKHWSGLGGQELLLLFVERAVRMPELGRESVLPWPELQGQPSANHYKFTQKVGHLWFHMQAQPLQESVLVHTCQVTVSSESLWEQVEVSVSRDISMGTVRTFCPCVQFNCSGFLFF